jgi:hypothetical protein
MPLLDHFGPPLYPQRSWESFHSRWANSIADELQRLLPPRYFAEVQIHLGSQVEADVAEFEATAEETQSASVLQEGGTAVRSYAPPAAALTMPACYPDDLEVHVLDERDDARLVAVIELVSPRNKDRLAARRGFAAKCLAYLQRGIGVIMVDVVTARRANLHNELISLLQLEPSFAMSDEATLYAAAYRPVRRGASDEIDVWPAELAVGEPLPQLPLALRGNGVVPVDLEAAYEEAKARSRIGP